MPEHLHRYTFQKCTDVEKDLPIFEVLSEDGSTIMDISMNDETNCIEVFFHQDIARLAVSLEMLRKIVEEGEQLLIGGGK